MAILTRVARHVISEAVKKQLEAELEEYRTSGVPVGDYIRGRVPALVGVLGENELVGVVERLRTSSVTPRDFAKRRRRSADASTSAERAAAKAAVARRRLEDLEAEVEALSERRPELDRIRARAAEKAEEVVGEARAETDRQIDVARLRLESLEARGAVHVEEIERKARLVERSIVATAEARMAQAQSRLAADLDRARIDARTLTEQAEAEMQRAERAATRMSKESSNADSSGPSTLVRSFAMLADERATAARRGRRRQQAAISKIRDLANLDRDELYAIARDRDIAGRSKMSKSELIDALRREDS